MKTEFEKQAFCNKDEARDFIRRKIALRKNASRKRSIQKPDAVKSALRDEALEVLNDDELVLEIFFSEEIPDVGIAKQVCLQCSVMETCLLDAVKREESCGVWGGQFFKDGAIDKPKRRGRPPKVARPEYEVLEVPISGNIRRFIEDKKQEEQKAA